MVCASEAHPLQSTWQFDVFGIRLAQGGLVIIGVELNGTGTHVAGSLC